MSRRLRACRIGPPPHPRRRLRGALQVLLALLSGCATVAPQREALPSAPAARLAAVQANEERIHSLRARFSSVAHVSDADRSADGVLLVVKPDRFRMRLMLPFGFTVFDYLCIGDQTWVLLPLAAESEQAKIDQYAPFSREDLGQAFLRGPYAFPGMCDAAPAPNDQAWVTCREGDALRRTILIGSDGIVEEATYSDGVQRLLIRYADYRSVGGTSLPFRITLEYPQRRQSVDIAIEGYEVNPVLSEDLFRPLAGSRKGA